MTKIPTSHRHHSLSMAALLCLLAYLLCGCSTNLITRNPLKPSQAASIQQTINQAGSAANLSEGFLLCSFSYTGDKSGNISRFLGLSPNFTYQFNYRQQLAAPNPDAKRIAGTLGIMPNSPIINPMRKDFQIPNGAGQVFAVMLPPGQYEFYQFDISGAAGYSTTTWSAKRDFSIPFTIKPGQATYVGEIRTNHIYSKGLFGAQIADGGLHTFHNEAQRDIPILRRVYPFLSQVPTAIRPIKGNLLNYLQEPEPENS